MENKFKAICLRISASLLCLLILHPLNLFAEQGQGKIDKIVKVKDGRISVSAEDEATFNILKETEVSDVLKKIEKETGVKMTIGEGLTGKKVENDFVDLDIETALRRLLNGTYYVLHYDQDPENKDNQILKEVKAGGPELGSVPIKGKITSIEIPYGSGKGMVGAVIGSEGSSGGPQSFTVDDDGNISICDTDNERIQIYSPDGSYLSTISLVDDAINKGKNGHVYSHWLTDIVVDSFSNIIIYDSWKNKLYQYDKKGRFLGSIATDTRIKAPIKIINNDIYIDGGNEDIFIAKLISDGKFARPTSEEIKKNKAEKGRQALSGRSYKGKNYGDGVNTEMEVVEKDGRKSMIVSYPPRKGIVHGPSLGEDDRGNLYSSNSKEEDKFRIIQIDKFDSNGDYIGTAQIPGGHQEFWSARSLYLKSGKIYNFIPEKDRLKIYVFSEDK